MTISEILGLEVHGTTGIVFANHYTASGFDDDWRFLLVGSSDLRRQVSITTDVDAPSWPRSFDLDALPAAPIDDPVPWSRRIADTQTSRAILRLIRRNAGASMPGLLAMPRCEVAIPARTPGTYHTLQVVLDGDFVRVYPDGAAKPGVLYPVTDAHLLRVLVDELPRPPQGDETQRSPIAY